MGKINRFTIFVLCFLFFILCFLFYLWQGVYLPINGLGQEELFSVKKGESITEIANNLEEQNLIKNKIFFSIYVLLAGNAKELQAGDYLISSSQSISGIMKKFIEGDTVKEKITIIEGWNLRDIAWYFENKGMFQAEEIFEVVGFPKADYSKTKDIPLPKDFLDEFSFLEGKPENLGLEGYLFPDTYEIADKESVEEIIKKVLTNFNKKLSSDLREEIDKQGKTIFEVINMASLLEREVKTLEDKKLISGILWKRLKNKIPLQVDATINYILERQREAKKNEVLRLTGKNITDNFKEDVKIDSPYNTYKYRGLPLGPICNPGLDSIIASIYPKDSNFWYYLSTPEGKTIFSKTLKEHNIAREKYLFQ